MFSIDNIACVEIYYKLSGNAVLEAITVNLENNNSNNMEIKNKVL